MAIKFLNTVAVDTDVLYVDTSNDRVGIGTDSPQAKLDVDGDTFLASRHIKISGTGINTYFTAATHDSSGTEGLLNKLSIKSVGTFFDHGALAITNTAVAEPLDTTIVQETISSGDTDWNVLTLPKESGTFALENWVTSNFAPSTGGSYLPLSAGSGSPLTDNLFIRGDDKGLVVQDAASTTNVTVGAVSSSAVSTGLITLRHSGTTKILLNANDNSYFNNGNVGIGTTSPPQKLAVIGNISLGNYNGSDFSRSIGINDSSGTYGNGSSYIKFNELSGSGTSGTTKGAAIEFYNHLWAGNTNQTMIIQANGNVGIGTTSPGVKLDVSDVIRGRNSIRVDGAITGSPYFGLYQGGEEKAYIQYVDSGDNLVLQSDGIFTFKTGTAERVRITAGGRVGIGITNPSAKLQVEDSANNIQMRVGSLTAGISPIIRFQGKNAADDTNYYSDIELDAENGKLIFNDPGTSSGSIGQNPMVLDSSGNVGIGTTSPTSKIHVIGQDATFYSNEGTQSMQVGRNANERLELYVNDQLAKITAIQDSDNNGTHDFILNRVFAGTGANNFRIQKDGSTQLIVDTTGNVGIGTTSPSYKLQVGNAGALADSIRIGSYDAVKNTRQYIGYARQDTGLFETSTSGNTPSSVLPGVSGIRIVNTEGSILSTKADQSIQLLTHIYNGSSRVALHANYDGNVGIGTTSPGNKLVVDTAQGTTFSEAFLALKASTVTDTIGRTAISLATSPVNNYGVTLNGIRQGSSSGEPRFGIKMHNNSSGGIEALSIRSSGNVGIGTTSPENKLHVQQSVLYTGIHTTAGIRIKSDGDGAVGNYHGTIALSRGTGSVAISAVQEATDSDVMGMAFFTHPSTIGGDAAVEQMRIDQNGNVGIGVTSPSARIHALHSGLAAKFVSSQGTALEVQGGGNSQPIARFKNTAASEKVTISSTGKVGIGVTAPSQLLHVAGNMRLQNQLYDSTNSLGSNGEVLTKVSAGTEWKVPAVNAQMPNNTAPASAANVGTIRYRSTSNTSFVDMSMQTGATTYTWVNIVSNFW